MREKSRDRAGALLSTSRQNKHRQQYAPGPSTGSGTAVIELVEMPRCYILLIMKE